MYILDLALYFSFAAIYLISIILYFTRKDVNRTIRYVTYFSPLVFSLVHLLLTNFNYFVIPIYLAAFFFAPIVFLKKKKILNAASYIMVLAMLLTPLSLITTNNTTNTTKLSCSDGFYIDNLSTWLGEYAPLEWMGIYSSMSYTNAFNSLNNLFKAKYPFTQWKGINFDAKYQEYLPKIQAAQQSHDNAAYYTALREYIYSILDGHISILPSNLALITLFPQLANILPLDNLDLINSLKNQNIGGTYGISVVKLDDGRVVADVVQPGSAAEQAGIAIGTQITKINDVAVDQALQNVTALWTDDKAANNEYLTRIKYSLLFRAPVGQTSQIKFLNSQGVETGVSLTAYSDNYAVYQQDMTTFYGEKANSIYSTIIDGKHGYVCIPSMMSDDKAAAVQQFTSIIDNFKTSNVDDLIIDVRGNGGGEDRFAAQLLSVISDREIYYLKECRYNGTNNTSQTIGEIICQPQGQGFTKPIVVLANNETASAGEGFVYNLNKLPNVTTAGITGTHGSFGTIEGGAFLPGGWFVILPTIKCCDQNDNIIIDSNQTGNGGVVPEARIPFNLDALNAIYSSNQDYELNYAVDMLSN